MYSAPLGTENSSPGSGILSMEKLTVQTGSEWQARINNADALERRRLWPWASWKGLPEWKGHWAECGEVMKNVLINQASHSTNTKKESGWDFSEEDAVKPWTFSPGGWFVEREKAGWCTVGDPALLVIPPPHTLWVKKNWEIPRSCARRW